VIDGASGAGRPSGIGIEESAPRSLAVTNVAPAVFTTATVVAVVSSQGGYFPTSWGWSALALLSVFCTWAIATGETDTGGFDAAFLVALVLLTAWVGLSIVWSRDPAQSVLELERTLVLLGGCVSFLALGRRASLRSLTVALVLAIGSVGVYSLSTRLIPDHFGSYDPIAGYRLSAPVGYWNSLGIFAVIGILLALGLATDRRGNVVTRAIGAAAVVPLPLVVYFTFSRASWVALGVGLAITIAISGQRLRLTTEAAFLALLSSPSILVASHSTALTSKAASLGTAAHDGHRVAAIVAVTGALAALSVRVLASLESRARMRPVLRRAYGAALVAIPICVAAVTIASQGGPESVAKGGYDSFISASPTTEPNDLNGRLFSLNGNGRVDLWRVAIDADHGHWLGGSGAGSFERNWDQSLTANQVVRDAHSLYVETLSELGVVGLVLLATMLGAPLVAAFDAREVALVPAAVGAYSAFVLHNAVDWDWELSGVALTGLFVGCLLLVVQRRRPERRIAGRARAAGVAVAGILAAFAGIAIVGNGALAHARTANEQHRYASAESDAKLARRWMPWSPEPLLALGEARLERGDSSGAAASFRQAISIDGRSWQAWLDLAASTHGAVRRHAIAKARALYPRSPEITEFEEELASH
jgi:hypothetical protein